MKEIPQRMHPTHTVDVGAFGVTRTVRKLKRLAWHNCRDTFQNVRSPALKRHGVFMKHSEGRGGAIALFLERIETELELDTKSVFHTTTDPDILWMRWSPWWLETKIRRSFLTLMLRVGDRHYNPKSKASITKIACSYSPAADRSRYAIKRFLAGHTIYKNETKDILGLHGWLDVFAFRSKKSDAEDLLVKP
jgi:hypothetical protein